MSFKDEIETQLKGLPRKYYVAFAVRCALRSFPLLAANEKKGEPFWYWKEDKKAKHLLAILQGIRFGLVGVFIAEKLFSGNYAAYADAAYAYAADAAYASDASAAAAAAYAASSSAAAAVFASSAYASASADEAAAYDAAYVTYDGVAYASAYDAAYASAYDAAYAAAAYAAAYDDLFNDYKEAIYSDLQILENNPEIQSYLKNPLWNQEIPKVIETFWQRFLHWAKELDAGFDVWLDWYHDCLDGKALDLELLEKQVNIPAEIKEQGIKAVNGYLATLSNAEKQQKELQPLNRVRAIFIGNGAAGKTSLIRALHGEPVVEGKEKMTPGIDIREWPVGNTDITAHFWDFGGQVMAHSTHQFFLRERCLYVLVMDARTEINANEQAEYWLEHVKAFGKNAPVMLVGNKSDLTQVNLDMFSLREKYPNIIDFYPISCTECEGFFQSRFETFKTDLIKHLQKVGTHQVYFTEEQFKVMQNLRERACHQAFLEQRDFEDLCSEQQITTEGDQNREWLLDLFDKLGVVIHFPQLARLDSFILNPRWLTYGIYTLLYSDQAQESEGVLSEANVLNILRTEKIEDEQGHLLDYQPDKCGFIIDAMEEFKLCYRLPADRKQIIIPDLLPSDQPEHGFEKNQACTLAFEFDFRGFLPRHVMPTLIVSRFDEIKNNTRWQQGALFHSDQYSCNALVQVDYHNRTLSFWLQGGQMSRYFTVLRDEVISILQRMENLPCQEWLYLSDDMRVPTGKKSDLELRVRSSQRARASFKQLLALEAAGQTQYISEDGIFDLSKILQVMPGSLRQNVASKKDEGRALNKPAQEVKIFISYTHENDEKHKDDLVITLKGIQREYPQLEWWHDRKLESGEWEGQILEQLEQADIVLLLISRYFMASDYCFTVEMEKALLKYRERGHLVVPIIVSHTPSWHKHEIGKHQALPKDGKPLDEWKNPDRFWGDVQRGLERELEKLLVNRNGD